MGGGQQSEGRTTVYSIGPSASIVSLRGFEVALQVSVAALAQFQNIVDKNYLALHKAFGEKTTPL